MVRLTGSIQFGLRHLNPYTLFGSIVSLVLVLINDPWWSVHGTADNNLFSIQVSPYYLKTLATGVDQTFPFAGPLGAATRIVLILGFLSLFSSSLRPNAWWHDLASYFGMSALAELFLSFLLMLHAAQTTLLGAYGNLPPFLGTSQLQGSILGLDLAYHVQPLITAGLGFPLFLALASPSSLALGLIVKAGRKKTRKRGIESIFSLTVDDTHGQV